MTKILFLIPVILILLTSCQQFSAHNGQPLAPTGGSNPAYPSSEPEGMVPAVKPTASKPLQSEPIPAVKPPIELPAATPFARSTREPAWMPTPPGGPFQIVVFELARQDLSNRTGISASQVEFLSAEEVTWRDASLGCPQPGMFYAQVLSPGYLLRLSAEGQNYTYHTDLASNAIWCERGDDPLPDLPVTPGQIDDGKPWVPVD